MKESRLGRGGRNLILAAGIVAGLDKAVTPAVPAISHFRANVAAKVARTFSTNQPKPDILQKDEETGDLSFKISSPEDRDELEKALKRIERSKELEDKTLIIKVRTSVAPFSPELYQALANLGIKELVVSVSGESGIRQIPLPAPDKGQKPLNVAEIAAMLLAAGVGVVGLKKRQANQAHRVPAISAEVLPPDTGMASPLSAGGSRSEDFGRNLVDALLRNPPSASPEPPELFPNVVPEERDVLLAIAQASPTGLIGIVIISDGHVWQIDQLYIPSSLEHVDFSPLTELRGLSITGGKAISVRGLAHLERLTSRDPITVDGLDTCPALTTFDVPGIPPLGQDTPQPLDDIFGGTTGAEGFPEGADFPPLPDTETRKGATEAGEQRKSATTPVSPPPRPPATSATPPPAPEKPGVQPETQPGDSMEAFRQRSRELIQEHERLRTEFLQYAETFIGLEITSLKGSTKDNIGTRTHYLSPIKIQHHALSLLQDETRRKAEFEDCAFENQVLREAISEAKRLKQELDRLYTDEYKKLYDGLHTLGITEDDKQFLTGKLGAVREKLFVNGIAIQPEVLDLQFRMNPAGTVAELAEVVKDFRELVHRKSDESSLKRRGPLPGPAPLPPVPPAPREPAGATSERPTETGEQKLARLVVEHETLRTEFLQYADTFVGLEIPSLKGQEGDNPSLRNGWLQALEKDPDFTAEELSLFLRRLEFANQVLQEAITEVKKLKEEFDRIFGIYVRLFGNLLLLGLLEEKDVTYLLEDFNEEARKKALSLIRAPAEEPELDISLLPKPDPDLDIHEKIKKALESDPLADTAPKLFRNDPKETIDIVRHLTTRMTTLITQKKQRPTPPRPAPFPPAPREPAGAAPEGPKTHAEKIGEGVDELIRRLEAAQEGEIVKIGLDELITLTGLTLPAKMHGHIKGRGWIEFKKDKKEGGSFRNTAKKIEEKVKFKDDEVTITIPGTIAGGYQIAPLGLRLSFNPDKRMKLSATWMFIPFNSELEALEVNGNNVRTRFTPGELAKKIPPVPPIDRPSLHGKKKV